MLKGTTTPCPKPARAEFGYTYCYFHKREFFDGAILAVPELAAPPSEHEVQQQQLAQRVVAATHAQVCSELGKRKALESEDPRARTRHSSGIVEEPSDDVPSTIRSTAAAGARAGPAAAGIRVEEVRDAAPSALIPLSRDQWQEKATNAFKAKKLTHDQSNSASEYLKDSIDRIGGVVLAQQLPGLIEQAISYELASGEDADARGEDAMEGVVAGIESVVMADP